MIELLNTSSCLDAKDEEEHYKEIELIIGKVVSVRDYDCALLCKYQDPGHRDIEQKVLSCRLSEVPDMIGRFDCKNGADIVKNGEYLNLVIYGHGYTEINTGDYHLVTMAVQILPYNEKRQFMDVTGILKGETPKVAMNQFESKYN